MPSESRSCDSGNSPLQEEDAQPAPAAATSDDNDANNPVGVGQATGLFGRLGKSWKGIAAAVGILALLGLAGFKRGALASGFSNIVNRKSIRRGKEEEAVRKKLRKQGIIK